MKAPPRRRARAPSRRNSTTANGCTSASAAPRTAVMFRSAPTSPASRSTNRSWSTTICACAPPSIDLKRSQTSWSAGHRTRRPRRKILRRKKPRRGSQPDQVQIPRQYEPRAAHAAQCHHRVFRDHGKRHVRHARLGEISGILPRHSHQRPLSAGSHQRHPRHVEDRGRPDEARHGAARPVEDAGGIAAGGVRARRRQEPDARRRYRRHHFGGGRSPRGQADHRQPAVQCGQVHARWRQGGGAKPHAAAIPSC